MVNAGSQLAGGALELTGQDGAANRVRRAGSTASRVLQSSGEQAGQIGSDFVSGVGDGVGGIVESLGGALANPVQTVEGLGRLAQVVSPVAQVGAVLQGRSPLEVQRENLQTVTGIIDGVREDYQRTGDDHGTAGQVGRAAFDIISTVFSGGSSAAGRGSLRAAANSLDDVSRASRAVSRGDDVVRVRRGTGAADDVTVRRRRIPEGEEVTEVGRGTGALGSALGRQMDGPLAPLAEGLTRLSERFAQRGVDRTSRQVARSQSRGQDLIREGRVPGRDGAEILGSSRQMADNLGDTLKPDAAAWRRGGAERESLMQQLPESARRRVQELEASGRADEALALFSRSQVEDVIRRSLDDVQRIDELYPTQLPANVDPSRVLAQGRRESLEFLLKDSAIDADNLRRSFRHIVGDSDVTGPVFIQQFRRGDEVGRAFSSGAGRQSGIKSNSFQEGGYYSSVEDARMSRSQLQERNALGLDNSADRFVRFTIPEDTYAVASRIGEQFEKYGAHATGGNLQFTFPPAIELARGRVSNVGTISAETIQGVKRGTDVVRASELAGGEQQ